MKNSRKILVGAAAAAGLALASAMTYAAPPAGFGAGAGPCAFGGSGPGMMGGRGPMGGGWGPGMMGYGPGGGYGPGMMGYGPGARGFGPGAAAGAGPVARVEGRLAFLKSELKITAEQEAAWGAYANQAKANAAAMETLRAQAPATPQSAAERMDRRAEFAQQRAERLKSMSAAVKELYAALTPEQKTTADRYFGGAQVSQLGPRGYGRGRW